MGGERRKPQGQKIELHSFKMWVVGKKKIPKWVTWIMGDCNIWVLFLGLYVFKSCTSDDDLKEVPFISLIAVDQ